MIETQELVAGYGPVNVLQKVSIKVQPKEIVAVIGPNGAGKSTLLKTLVGLIEPRLGTIRYDGKPITGITPEKALLLGLALVPEGRGILSGLTVYENLLIGAYVEKNKKIISERISDVYARFPVLAERSNQIAVTLSGGEQQQLAIARALMSAPKMLMLDEPSLGLAPNLVQKVMDLLCDLRADGITVLLVEQNITQALAISDRVYVMSTGKILFEGPSAKFIGKNEELEQAYLGGVS
ncbi:MAG: ABC transporter ATP-binding protein [Chloroflexi bacterium RBG_19FT_COMBO_47_9]|nr:MAG: ABC transporter ATP-binding protein [Chloroflexi bacterium RBG_19FT_COMBO_47_9]